MESHDVASIICQALGIGGPFALAAVGRCSLTPNLSLSLQRLVPAIEAQM